MAGATSNNISYELCDAETGDMYKIQVTRQEAARLDLDHLQRHRLLSKLKSSNTPALYHWDVSHVVSSPIVAGQGPSLAGAMMNPKASSSPLPRLIPRATGTKGGKWNDESTTIFLRECAKVRQNLLSRVVPDSVYELLSNTLYELPGQLNYSPGQLRVKMKNLKRTFSEACRGQHNGMLWKFHSLMQAIFGRGFNPTIYVEDDCALGLQHFDEEQSVYLHKSHVSLERSASSEYSGDVLSLNCTADLSGGLLVEDRNDQEQIKEVSQTFLSFDETNSHSVEPPVDLEVTSLSIDDKGDEIEFDESENAGILNLPHATGARAPGPEVSLATVNEFRSPLRKKGNYGNGTPTTQRRTPTKNPRRKLCTQAALMWSPENLQVLLHECLKRKDKVQKEESPDSLWKEIAKSANEAGEVMDFTWQLCKAKYTSVCGFFFGTLLRVGGIMAGRKCPYYDILCEIHDIPDEFVMPREASVVCKNGNRIWTGPAIALLISLYSAKKATFDATNSFVRHNLLFGDIAEAMSHYDHTFTSNQVKAQWNVLKGRYMEEYDSCNKTGSAPSTWEWFDDFDKMFGDSAGVEPPFSCSLGTSSQYTSKTANPAVDNRGTRTRGPSVPPSVQPSTSKGSKKQTFRSRAVELQEKQVGLQLQRVNHQGDFLEEMRQMRQDYNNNCMYQSALLEMLIEKKNK